MLLLLGGQIWCTINMNGTKLSTMTDLTMSCQSFGSVFKTVCVWWVQEGDYEMVYPDHLERGTFQVKIAKFDLDVKDEGSL